MKNFSKYCALCAKHGEAKTTHNTGNCKKYEKGRVFKKTFKSQKGKSPVNKTFNRQYFKTMEDNIKNVRTELEKMKKSSCKSKKRESDKSSTVPTAPEALGWIVRGN